MSGPVDGTGRPRGGSGWRRPPSAAERDALLRDSGAPTGLCAGCLHLRLLRSGRSRFVRCALAETDPAYPRYPELPVQACAGYRRWDAGDENGAAGQRGEGAGETGEGSPGDGVGMAREAAAPPAATGGRGLPLLYFGLAHLCLLAAFVAVALEPSAVAGFYYHPRALAVVHLVTLGWITASILGALYIIVPLALGGRLPAGRADGWLLGVYALGATGMASHFWLEEPLGMAGSAVMAAAAALWVAGRAVRAVGATRTPREVRLHFQLAFLNLLLAAGLGVAVAFDKLRDLLPGSSLDHVVAHAHLAALGWATMMVMAAGYRLLPMILPAAPPTGGWVWAGAVVTEAGVVGLSLTLYAGAGPVAPFALLCAGGLLIFLSRVAWMLRHRRPPPATLPRPEIGRFHVGAALLWLLAAIALGLAVALAPATPWRQAAILVYGAAGLVGFLSQIVVGIAGRLVPLWVWLAEIGGRPHATRPPSPYSLADRRLQLAVLALWTAGVPLLAAGLGLDARPAIRAGAAALALAAATGAWQLAHVCKTARRAAESAATES